MNNSQDRKWQDLLARCAPTFAAESSPPYGLLTSTLARLSSARCQQLELERLGCRALFASLALLVAVVGFTVGLQLQEPGDLEPGVRNLAEVENIALN